MWEHNYTPIANSLLFSTLVAAIPLVILFYMLGVKRKPSWMAGLSALGVAAVLAIGIYGMPVTRAAASIVYGAAFGLFPIGWIVIASLILYRVTLDTGKFEIIKDSIGALSDDRRLQAVLIGFAFGAFIEGAAGFGTPVAVAAAMLTGLGFSPFYAAFICLVANTAPVAFGSLGIPVVTLAGITELPMDALSSMTGRLCALIAIVIPAYMVIIMSGFKRATEVLPPIVACSVTFAGVLLFVTNTIGPEVAVILASIAALVAMVLVMKVWQPKQVFRLEGDIEATTERHSHTTGEIVSAWSPYILLVVFVLAWRYAPVQAALNSVSMAIEVPGLHNLITRVPPLTPEPSPYAAVYNFQWLSAAGTSCFLSAFAASLLLGLSPGKFFGIVGSVLKQLSMPLLTIASVLGVAFVMNYAGMTSTLGLAFAATGALFPFFSAMLGWTGVFLTGSDTSSNALFGTLQMVTANALGLNPVLTASTNAATGVMGKMISLQSIAVAVAATGMASSEEGRLFRITLKHSIILALFMGVVTMVFAYVLPQLVPQV
ncbi:MAG: lactate permease LctP family transporter [Vicinamibacterales bacterium]|jgi:lactate permease|nr:lactate permease LctP family transporter [Vicinamibacterales bacterium]